MYFLGIDGGGTKSLAVIIDESGKTVCQSQGKGMNYHCLGLDNVENNLHELISSLIEKVGKIDHACFGLAQVDSKEDHDKVYSHLKKGKIGKLLKCDFTLLNDVQIILPTVTNNSVGVAVIGGTGSHFYACNNGKEARASGIDFLLSDEGSAFDIGLKVLRAAVRSYDGRGEKTILEEMVLEGAGVNEIRDLVNVIHKDEFDKRAVANFAPLAEQAALKNDAVAKKILSEAAGEYVNGIKTVCRRCEIEMNDNFDIVCVGSVFKNKFLVEKMKNDVSEFSDKARIHYVNNVAVGAAKYAINEFKKSKQD